MNSLVLPLSPYCPCGSFSLLQNQKHVKNHHLPPVTHGEQLQFIHYNSAIAHRCFAAMLVIVRFCKKQFETVETPLWFSKKFARAFSDLVLNSLYFQNGESLGEDTKVQPVSEAPFTSSVISLGLSGVSLFIHQSCDSSRWQTSQFRQSPYV